MAVGPGKYDLECSIVREETRAHDALQAGVWCGSDGRTHRVREMADAHLVHALLKALQEGSPVGLTQPLSAEVVRRGLRDYAMSIAQSRQEASHGRHKQS